MSELTSSSGSSSHGGPKEIQEGPVSRVWVKPTLEKLSLKQALAGGSGSPEIANTNTGS